MQTEGLMSQRGEVIMQTPPGVLRPRPEHRGDSAPGLVVPFQHGGFQRPQQEQKGNSARVKWGNVTYTPLPRDSTSVQYS